MKAATEAVQLTALVIILLLAAATRIHNIDGPSLWIDEGFTYFTFKTDLFTALVGDRHPPLYFYSLHLWESLTGDSILALRYWSFLPSLLSIAVVYQIAREVTRETIRERSWENGILTIPLIAALMMALADGENYLAQELRMYTWQVFWLALSTWFYLRWMRKPSRVHAGLWVAAMTGAMYTHYFSALALMVYGVHALLTLPLRRKVEAVGLLALVGILIAPWVLLVFTQQFRPSDACFGCGEIMNLETLRSFRQSWFGQMWPLTMLLALFGVAAVVNGRVRLPSRATLLIVLLGLLPLVMTFIVSHQWLEFFNHHLAQLTIPVVVLLALGIGNFQQTGRLVLVAALLLYGVTTVDWYRQKVPWRELVAQFAPYVESNHLVLSEIGAEEAALGYYFDHLLPEEVQISSFEWWGTRDVNAYYNQQLPPLIAGQRERQADSVTTAWFVYWNANTAMRDQLLGNGFVPTMTWTVEHLGVTIPAYRYDLLPEETLTTFEGGLMLRAAEIAADDLRIDLWWSLERSADAVPTTDFVTKAFVLDANGQQVAQLDSQPAFGTRPTTSFTAGEVVYDPKALQLAEGISQLPPGRYTVAVQVYRFEGGSIVISPTADGDDYAIIGEIER
jgi:hypothetical protein